MRVSTQVRLLARRRTLHSRTVTEETIVNLPPRIWTADEPVRRAAAQDWVASRLAWEGKVLAPSPLSAGGDTNGAPAGIERGSEVAGERAAA